MKKKDFKQVTVRGKIYHWKINENVLSIWKDGNKLLEKTNTMKPTANVVRDIVSEYLATIKPYKVLTKTLYGTLGSRFYDVKNV